MNSNTEDNIATEIKTPATKCRQKRNPLVHAAIGTVYSTSVLHAHGVL